MPGQWLNVALLRAVTWLLERRFQLVDVIVTRHHVEQSGEWHSQSLWMTRSAKFKASSGVFDQHARSIDERSFERRAWIEAQRLCSEVEES